MRLCRRGEEPEEYVGTTVARRLAAVWEITTQVWGIAGLPMPIYDRSTTPVRLCRRDEAGS